MGRVVKGSVEDSEDSVEDSEVHNTLMRIK